MHTIKNATRQVVLLRLQSGEEINLAPNGEHKVTPRELAVNASLRKLEERQLIRISPLLSDAPLVATTPGATTPGATTPGVAANAGGATATVKPAVHEQGEIGEDDLGSADDAQRSEDQKPKTKKQK